MAKKNVYKKYIKKRKKKKIISEVLPKEIKEKYANNSITFSDLIKYPVLREYVHEDSFGNPIFNINGSTRLIEMFGFKNALRLFDEYPKFVEFITEYSYYYNYLMPLEKKKSYKELKRILYENLMEAKKIPPKGIAPNEMINLFPQFFLKNKEIPEDKEYDFYKKYLNIKDIRKYRKVLINKDLSIGFHHYEYVESCFGDVWTFIDLIPEQFDEIVDEYIYVLKRNNQKITDINTLIKKAIIYGLRESNHYNFKDNQKTLEDYYFLSKYVDIDDLFENKNLVKLINICGFENLINFNKKYNDILNFSDYGSHFSGRLLSHLSPYIDYVDKKVIESRDTFLVIKELIHKARGNLYFSEAVYRKLFDIFPDEFLDRDALKEVLADNLDDYNSILYAFDNQSKSLLYYVKIYPGIVPLIKDKRLFLHSDTTYIYERYNDVFWDLCIKYGNSWIRVIEEINKNLLDDLINNNYNVFLDICEKFGNNIHIDMNLKNLPDNFKEKYRYLYLDDDAPKSLKKVYYNSNGFVPIITPEHLRSNPDWAKYLFEKNLKNVIKIENFDYFEKYIKKYGNERFLNICITYGKYLDGIMHSLQNKSYNNEKDLVSNIERLIEKDFLNNKISYSKDLPVFLIDKLNLDIKDDAPSDIKEIFKTKSLTFEKLEDKRYYDYFIKNVNIACAFSDSYLWTIHLFGNLPLEKANKKRLMIIKEFDKLYDPTTQIHFIDYMNANQFNLNFDKLTELTEVLTRISTGNSLELLSFENSLINAVLKTEKPLETLNKIENIFIKNNLPQFVKIFLSFKIIYPTMEGITSFKDNEKLSPILTDEHLKYVGNPQNDIEAKFNLIYNTLLRITIHSHSRNFVEYLDNIEKGDKIYKNLVFNNKTFLDLTKKEIEELSIFVNHLEALYENTKEGRKIKHNVSDLSLEERFMFFAKLFKPTKNNDLKDRIIKNFVSTAGYSTFDEVKSDIIKFRKDANERNKKAALELGEKELFLDEGDFIRGIGDYKVLSSSLENGNVSNEFLSIFTKRSTSDSTPLDVDFGRVQKKVLPMDTHLSTPFFNSEIMLVIKKDNPNFYITRDESGKVYDLYDPKKGDLFKTLSYNHFGSTVGIAIDEVDYILYNNQGKESLNIVKYELARNKKFIPVVDFNTSKLIFTYDEYEEIRKKMQGLSYYGDNTYEFSPNIVNEEVLNTYKELKGSETNIKHIKSIYSKKVRSVLQKHGIELYTDLIGNLDQNKAEFIDTGSTGRSTYVPNHEDFDFILKLDQKIMNDYKKLHEIQKDLRSFYTSFISTSNVKLGGFRDKGVIIRGIDRPINIDVTFMPRTDKITYSTDQCVKDRLETIKKIDENKYKMVIANIVLAKKLFKSRGVYKSKEEGGLGGIGVETWILTNGGSLIDAARSFCECAKDKTFLEFKNAYPLYNFGENHRVLEDELVGQRRENVDFIHIDFIHNDFINNLSETGFEKIKQILTNYIKNIDLKNKSLTEENLEDLSLESERKSLTN